MTRENAQVMTVTGGGAGIGRAVTRARGAAARGLQSTADEAPGGAAMTWPVDARDAAAVHEPGETAEPVASAEYAEYAEGVEYAQAFEERPGPVDMRVNAAFEAFRAPPRPAEHLASAARSPRAAAPAGVVGAFGRR